MEQDQTNTLDRAYAHLRDRLVAFRVKPGERLNESELAAALGMSRAPIREALNRLVADGLVRLEAGRGFFCRRLSATEITDLYALRYDLEAGALAATLKGAPQEALERFARHWREVLARSGAMALDDLVAADEAFHLELAGLAGNAPRLKFLGNVNDRIRFVRRLNLEPPARREGAFAEHGQLVDALLARDRAAALEGLRRHLDHSTEEVRLQVQTALARIYADEVA